MNRATKKAIAKGLKAHWARKKALNQTKAKAYEEVPLEELSSWQNIPPQTQMMIESADKTTDELNRLRGDNSYLNKQVAKLGARVELLTKALNAILQD